MCQLRNCTLNPQTGVFSCIIKEWKKEGLVNALFDLSSTVGRPTKSIFPDFYA